MISGMRICREIAEQPALRPYVVGGDPAGPGVDDEPSLTRGHPRQRGVSNLHPVGTCRMGPRRRRGGRSAAAGARRRGLRVADASIMPQRRRRQHQRADDHDRREGRRHGAPGGAVALRLPERGPPGPHHEHERTWRSALRQEAVGRIPCAVSTKRGDADEIPALEASATPADPIATSPCRCTASRCVSNGWFIPAGRRRLHRSAGDRAVILSRTLCRRRRPSGASPWCCASAAAMSPSMSPCRRRPGC